MLDRIW